MSDFCRDYPVYRTRIERPCCWCGETIPKGSSAQRWAGHHHGDFWAGYMHPECDAAYRRTGIDDIEDGWTEGEFSRGMTPREARQSNNAINYWAR